MLFISKCIFLFFIFDSKIIPSVFTGVLPCFRCASSKVCWLSMSASVSAGLGAFHSTLKHWATCLSSHSLKRHLRFSVSLEDPVVSSFMCIFIFSMESATEDSQVLQHVLCGQTTHPGGCSLRSGVPLLMRSSYHPLPQVLVFVLLSGTIACPTSWTFFFLWVCWHGWRNSLLEL